MYRSEHPKTQFFRPKWLNLNGIWDFSFDFGDSGKEKKWEFQKPGVTQKINVPFCVESKLSGVEYKDFANAIWYFRSFKLPKNWETSRTFIHFGAVDYEAHVYINGHLAGKHIGGGVSFSFEITEFLNQEENKIAVYIKDLTKANTQPLGKQSTKLNSYSCLYTRTTGIWQTVWLESRGNSFIEEVKITPNVDNSSFLFQPKFQNINNDMIFEIKILDNSELIGSKYQIASNGTAISIEIPNPKLWSPETPFLYDIEYTLKEKREYFQDEFECCDGKNKAFQGNDETILDQISSYAGLRKIHIEGNKFYLNNQEIFLRFVLDQGFYPDGIWTAPSDEALKNDILLSMNTGFNGARLHQKIFEERFLYWADKLGYLVWAEYYDWGINYNSYESFYNHTKEWIEEIKRDYNHPSIIGWTPFNETLFGAMVNKELHDIHVKDIIKITHDLDKTRPVNDCSGYIHVETDIYTIHDYDQNWESFEKRYSDVNPNNFKSYEPGDIEKILYKGQPFVIDEYGGTWWALDEENKEDWGYGQKPKSITEVYERIKNLTKVIIDNPNIAGFCYTQLTDVELEKNGIYTYNREEKFDISKIKSYFSQKRQKI